MTYVVTSSSLPIPIGPLTILQSREITAATVWLVVVILLAVIVLVVVGCAPPAAVAAVAGGSLIAGKLRQELA
jgi:hypothetical protein